MYIKSVHLENIRCIEQLDLAFEEGHEAGWHVLIGENGSGKTTVARAVALGTLGQEAMYSLPFDFETLLRNDADNAVISFKIVRAPEYDLSPEFGTTYKEVLFDDGFLDFGLDWHRVEDEYDYTGYIVHIGHEETRLNGPFDEIKIEKANTYGEFIGGDFATAWLTFDYVKAGWFSSSFGPFRRFLGEDSELSKHFKKNPRAAAHLSLFGEEIALSEIVPWLIDLRFRELDSGKKSITVTAIRKLINEGALLPNGLRISKIGPETILFENGSIRQYELKDLSDGYRSVLSLTIELIRQLLRCYGEEKVFANIQQGEMNIPVPGVVIIDEVDAHLHPTWQTQIGQWFTRYFPKIQFIVTTHSPLICRACGEHGKIFRLAAPGSKHESGEITGVDRDRLVYGDILAAYETDAFGDKVEWGQEGRDLQKEYRELAYKRRFGVELTEEETAKYERLKAIFRSHVEAD
jgi:predicted ATPase